MIRRQAELVAEQQLIILQLRAHLDTRDQDLEDMERTARQR